MQEENNAVDIQQEAKEIVMKELEKNGVINYMRAKIKKSIIDIISHQKESIKQKLDFDFMTPLHRLNKPKEIVLVCQLIKEFLKFYELEYTLPIFENESNIREDIKRETLLRELKLEDKKDSSKPVLLLLLQDKLNRKDDAINNPTNKNIDRYDFNYYNKSEGELSNSETNKNQLNPTSFGNTNKSLDMTEPVNNNKFNNFNINEVYKNDSKSSSGSLIDEMEKIKDSKNKEISNDNNSNEKINDNLSNKEKEGEEKSNINNDDKSNENKEINKEINNILNKNDENQDIIIEEIDGKEIRQKEDSKNVESLSSQAYDSTASNK
jgi:FGFR1 oncogene partner